MIHRTFPIRRLSYALGTAVIIFTTITVLIWAVAIFISLMEVLLIDFGSFLWGVFIGYLFEKLKK